MCNLQVGELYDEASLKAVLEEWFRTFADLPLMIRQSVELGLFSSAQLVRFLCMDVRPGLTRKVTRVLSPRVCFSLTHPDCSQGTRNLSRSKLSFSDSGCSLSALSLGHELPLMTGQDKTLHHFRAETFLLLCAGSQGSCWQAHGRPSLHAEAFH